MAVLKLRMHVGQQYSRYICRYSYYVPMSSHSDASLQLNVKEPPCSRSLFQDIALAYLHDKYYLFYYITILLLGLENLEIWFWNMNEAFRKDEEESSNLTNVVFKGCGTGRKPRTFFWVPYLHAMWLLIATSASKWEPYYNVCMKPGKKSSFLVFEL